MLQTQTHAHFNDENMSQAMSSPASKKRKRAPADAPGHDLTAAKRTSLSHTNGNGEHLNGSTESYGDSASNFSSQIHPSNAAAAADDEISSTAAAALTAHLRGPDSHNISFSSATATEDRQLEESFSMPDSAPHTQNSPYTLSHYGGSAPGSMTQSTRDGSSTNGMKPAVGTDEWHKVRRDNHKEVERRRRETINEGINELAKIVPGCEKNKGSILARAVTYINELKQREEQAGEKKVLEKVVLEQAVQELMNRNEQLQSEVHRLLEENAVLKRRSDRNYSGDSAIRESGQASTGSD